MSSKFGNARQRSSKRPGRPTATPGGHTCVPPASQQLQQCADLHPWRAHTVLSVPVADRHDGIPFGPVGTQHAAGQQGVVAEAHTDRGLLTVVWESSPGLEVIQPQVYSLHVI